MEPEEIAWTKELIAAYDNGKGDYDSEERALYLFSKIEIVQTAIVSKGNLKKGIKRLKRYAKVKKKYALDKYDVATCMNFADEKFPGIFHTCSPGSGSKLEGSTSIAMHYAEFVPSVIRTKEDWCLMVKFFVTLMDAATCTLEHMRKGVNFVSNCNGFGWKNFSLDMERKMADVYQDAYPMKIKSMIVVDLPWFMTAMVKLVKVFLKPKLAQRIKLISKDVLLTDFFQTHELPTCMGGTHRADFREWMLERLEARKTLSASIDKAF